MKLEIKGHDVTIAAADLPEPMCSDLMVCGGPGDQQGNVDYFISQYEIVHDSLADYLRGYGAWDENDLADEEENLRRIIWIIGGDLAEYGIAELSKDA